ncbi:hypothetical protein ACLBKT_01635 [Erythrobacter sp. W302b]|uniref:hypothetical protein n=1 Tax=Erythrobacter sp. W302b TaxID=3389874 RepID=UPI00396AFB38
MSRSITISVFGAALATIAYLWLVPPPWTEQGIATVAIAGFNIVALVALFAIFYRSESASNAQFGKEVRENLGTIVPAMIISLIAAIFSLVRALNP